MPRRTVEVRRAVPADADLLLALAEQARVDAGVERTLMHPQSGASRERLATAMERSDVEVHLAVGEGEPVGVVVLRVGELLGLSDETAVHVDQLYVAPAWRRRGVARQLLAAAVAAGERAGAEDVACVVPPSGREVQRFFARLGFARLVTLRVVPLSRLRTKLASEGDEGRRRVALDQLVARRRRQLDRPETPPSGLPALPLAAAGRSGAVPAAAERRPVSAVGRRAAGR